MIVGVNMYKPVAVLGSDIHFNINTLPLADKALRMMVDKAGGLGVPLIIAGDLHDTKANIRGECSNNIIEILELCHIMPYVIRGNHCSIHEKSKIHSLKFLKHVSHLVSEIETTYLDGVNRTYLIAYNHDVEDLKAYIKTIPKGSCVIMHQGLVSTNAGHYIQDKSAITKEDVAGLRVISGHYHTRQTIDLPNGGKWDYIGNPFTLNYGEASDPPKGFQILMDDGSLEFVPTNLRKHVVFEFEAKFSALGPMACPKVNENDLLWIKAKGTREELSKLNKKWVSSYAGLDDNFAFKLDLIPTDDKPTKQTTKLTKRELLDSIIDSLSDSTERKLRLKNMWKDLI